MYQAEIDLEKRGFRLWRCPQCDGRRTNEEGLVHSAPQEIHDVREKRSGALNPMNHPNIASGRTDQPRLARHENHSLRGDKTRDHYCCCVRFSQTGMRPKLPRTRNQRVSRISTGVGYSDGLLPHSPSFERDRRETGRPDWQATFR